MMSLLCLFTLGWVWCLTSLTGSQLIVDLLSSSLNIWTHLEFSGQLLMIHLKRAARYYVMDFVFVYLVSYNNNHNIIYF